ncbi:MAG: hypothetical protein GEV03_29005 [Streptosporangiales bacterium]|nr:hypothetical protein [Streptosporangiales bacterium]
MGWRLACRNTTPYSPTAATTGPQGVLELVLSETPSSEGSNGRPVLVETRQTVSPVRVVTGVVCDQNARRSGNFLTNLGVLDLLLAIPDRFTEIVDVYGVIPAARERLREVVRDVLV